MTRDQERWAFASKIMEKYGAEIGRHVMSQLHTQLDRGDADGVKFWEDIHQRIVELSGPPVGSKPN